MVPNTLSFLFLLASLTSACEFPAIINFGDSNSDTGGYAAAFGALPPPYGETYFGLPVGRYSDGRLIIDFIAGILKLPYLSAYLNSMGTNFSCGVNFASSGSSVLPPTMINFNPISLNIQFLQFLEFKSKSTLISKQVIYGPKLWERRRRGSMRRRKKGGFFKDLMPKQDYFSRALYTIDIGQNDIAHAYVLNMTQVEIKLFIPSILDKLSMTIKDIYGEGGRFFWIHNTAPLGCLPYLLDRIPPTQDQMDKTGCSNPVNEVAQFFNSRLNETVVQLRRDLPSATFTYVDIYSVKYKLISQATQYGFEHPLQACCGRGGGKYNYDRFGRCFENVKGLRSCSDPSTRISFDGIHFTEAANRWIFERISGGAFSDPSTSLINACQQ